MQSIPNYSDSSRLVSVMMDDNSKENTRDNGSHSPTISPRPQSNPVAQINGQSPIRNNNNNNNCSSSATPPESIIPKLERPDTPLDHDQMEMDDKKGSFDALQSIFLTAQEREEWKDVIEMNDYLVKGRRPQFWEEPFTKRVMDAIKNKNLEMKKAAKLLGVSYGTLYGRYRETYGCLKGYRGPFSVPQATSGLTIAQLTGQRPWGSEIMGAAEAYLDASSNLSY